jgi:hypothetical protein
VVVRAGRLAWNRGLVVARLGGMSGHGVGKWLRGRCEQWVGGLSEG